MTLDDGMKECKFILYCTLESQLISLFHKCHSCGLEVQLESYRSFVGGKWHKLSMDMCYIGNHSQW